jgi:pimeloyl-ACP methyl ester carboxylesterase
MIPFLAYAAAALLLITVLGAVYQTLSTQRDLRSYPPPGKLIDIGTHRLHLLESGKSKNTPTIVLEAGLMSTILSWEDLQRDLSKSYKVVSYDRAGLGWSDPGPMPRTAGRMVDELHTALQRAAILPPYILVGHSFGGLTMPLFAARYGSEVAGMVLVDAVAPAEWNPPSEHDGRQARIGAKVCRRAAVLARIGLIRLVAFLLTTPAKEYGARLVRFISRGTPDDSGTVSSPWFAALPPKERAMAAVFWVHEKFAVTIASQLENLPRSAAQAAQCEVFCDKKVILLSAATSSTRRREEHGKIAARLPNGEHLESPESNHWIMQQDPAALIRAIETVVEYWETHQPQPV